MDTGWRTPVLCWSPTASAAGLPGLQWMLPERRASRPVSSGPSRSSPSRKRRFDALAERGCKFISVEMSNGQMREDIRLASGCRPVELVCRYGGNLIRLDSILEKIREVA